MAKDIKIVKCPNCGSIHKTEIKPDYFRCNNCQTEYYLDDNDINVNVNYNHNPPSNVPVDPKKIVAIAVGLIAFMVLLFSVGIFSNHDHTELVPVQPRTEESVKTPEPVKKAPYDYESEKLYTNLLTSEPVLVQLAREEIVDTTSKEALVNVRTIFLDPAGKKEIKDVILLKRVKKSDPHGHDYAVLKDGSIYLIYNNSTLYKLNRKADAWVDVTPDLIKNHRELNTGIASMRYYDFSLAIITLDGDKFYYIPTTNQIYHDYSVMESVWYSKDKTPYFEFRKNKDEDINKLLVRITPVGQVDQVQYEKLQLNRKFFDPEILYQDKENLLVDVNTRYGAGSPSTLQSLSVTNGKLKWSLPAKQYSFISATKCKEGYAVRYTLDDVKGIYIISTDGKIISDYHLTDK